jgi:hypothetical protein
VPVATPLTASGTLFPAIAGATITVTFSPSGGNPPKSATTTTDGAGNYATSVANPSGVPTTWSIQASYAGAPGVRPAQSVPCTTTS